MFKDVSCFFLEFPFYFLFFKYFAQYAIRAFSLQINFSRISATLTLIWVVWHIGKDDWIIFFWVSHSDIFFMFYKTRAEREEYEENLRYAISVINIMMTM